MMKQLRFHLVNNTGIAYYQQEKHRGKRYKKGSSAMGWAGLKIVINALQRKGYPIDACNKDTVQNHKVILVSITSTLDWYSFIAERMQWEKGNYTIIAGGPGVDNVRPLLEFVDVFVFGRGEDVIVPLIEAVLSGSTLDHPSVCFSKDFNIDKRYEIAQPTQCYPNTIYLTTGQPWKEIAIGCQRKCLFCNYSWRRKHTGLTQRESGSANALWGQSVESTIFQLDLDKPQSWPKGGHLIFGVDGLSERLRKMVNKPITRQMLEKFLRNCPQVYGQGQVHKIKWYNIVGLPTETEDDWEEMRQLMYTSSAERVIKDSMIAKVHIHNTPFKAAPATPAATWPVAYRNLREEIVPRLQYENCKQYKFGLYAGTTVDFNATYGTESLATTAKWMIIFRGLESDASLIANIATSSKFKNGNTAQKLEWLENQTNIDRFFKAYTWNTLPTRYLHTHTSNETMAKMSDRLLRQYGGNAGILLADEINGE